jgi:hypothetical protein
MGSIMGSQKIMGSDYGSNISVRLSVASPAEQFFRRKRAMRRRLGGPVVLALLVKTVSFVAPRTYMSLSRCSRLSNFIIRKKAEMLVLMMGLVIVTACGRVAKHRINDNIQGYESSTSRRNVILQC